MGVCGQIQKQRLELDATTRAVRSPSSKRDPILVVPCHFPSQTRARIRCSTQARVSEDLEGRLSRVEGQQHELTLRISAAEAAVANALRVR